MTEDKLTAAIRMMISTDRMHRKLFDTKLGDIGMHRGAHIILVNIAKSEGMPSQKKLAEILGITPAAVTGALKKLECDGYISRKLGSDNRYNEINITERGRKILEDTREAFRAIDRSLFDGFTEEEIDIYISCLTKMQENINKRINEEGEK